MALRGSAVYRHWSWYLKHVLQHSSVWTTWFAFRPTADATVGRLDGWQRGAAPTTCPPALPLPSHPAYAPAMDGLRHPPRHDTMPGRLQFIPLYHGRGACPFPHPMTPGTYWPTTLVRRTDVPRTNLLCRWPAAPPHSPICAFRSPTYAPYRCAHGMTTRRTYATRFDAVWRCWHLQHVAVLPASPHHACRTRNSGLRDAGGSARLQDRY